MIARRFFEAFLALLAISSGQTLAQTSTESRVEKLEKTVRLLERRVATLEDHLRQRNAALSVLSDKANWRKLQKGL